MCGQAIAFGLPPSPRAPPLHKPGAAEVLSGRGVIPRASAARASAGGMGVGKRLYRVIFERISGDRLQILLIFAHGQITIMVSFRTIIEYALMTGCTACQYITHENATQTSADYFIA